MIAPIIQFALWALTFFGQCKVTGTECEVRYTKYGEEIIVCPQPQVDCSCAGERP